MRFICSAVLVLCATLAGAARPIAAQHGWLGAWTTANVPMEQDRAAALRNEAHLGSDVVTIRQTVHMTYAGKQIRVSFSNEFGTAPLTISAAHVAYLGAASKITPGTDHTLFFNGQPSITIPAGGFAASDVLTMPERVPIYSDLVISMALPPQAIPVITFHNDARSTAYFATGDRTAAPELASPMVQQPGLIQPDILTSSGARQAGAPVKAPPLQPGQMLTAQQSSFFFLKDVEVERGKKDIALVCFGDSITDGTASTTDTNRRWPDQLAGLFSIPKKTPPVSVLNAGIGGNRLLQDGYGPKAPDRFDRDVLSQPGVKLVILLEGINDIGSHRGVGVTAEQIIDAQTELARRAHAQGIRIFGATLTPYEGAGYYTPEGEALRQQVNAFERSNTVFDGVIDFDKALQDPQHPGRLLQSYDSGDHLHPSDAGYAAMAAAVPMKLLKGK